MTARKVARLMGSIVLTVALVFSSISGAQDSVPEPEGFKLDHYRGAVPATLKGGKVVGTEEAEKLWRERSAVFVDVLPRPPKPNLPAGTVYREKPRNSIPGSVWLADVGYGALPPEMEVYFKAGLKRATGGDLATPVLFFCLAQCWMSWNAAKRAIGYGYTNVIWYPQGTDGWAEAGLPTEIKEPEPRPGETQ
jgi:PQQ-dependent catabolism-associated CXXCW motif protein